MVVDFGKKYNIFITVIFLCILKALCSCKLNLLAFGWIAVTSETLQTGILKWCGERS